MSIGQHLFSLFIVLVLLSTSSLMAQGQEIKQSLKGTRSLEVFAGPSLVYNHGSEEFDEYGKAKLAYHFGLNVRHHINNRFSVSTSLGFYRKGYRQEFEWWVSPDFFQNPSTTNMNPELTIHESNLNNDYINAKLILEWWVSNELFVGLGFYGGRLIKSQLTSTDTQNGQVVYEVSSSQIDGYEEYDWGSSISIGYRPLKFIDGIGFSASFDYGLSDIVLSRPNVKGRKNLMYNFSLNYKFL